MFKVFELGEKFDNCGGCECKFEKDWKIFKFCLIFLVNWINRVFCGLVWG